MQKNTLATKTRGWKAGECLTCTIMKLVFTNATHRCKGLVPRYVLTLGYMFCSFLNFVFKTALLR